MVRELWFKDVFYQIVHSINTKEFDIEYLTCS